MARSACIITCAGSSTRMGGGTKKEYRLLDGISVLERSILAFLDTGLFETFVITVPKDGEAAAKAAVSPQTLKKATFLFVPGGASRRESVLCGLKALEPSQPGIVLIHDAARPFVTGEIIASVRVMAARHGAAAPAVGVVDTIKEINPEGAIVSHPKRSTHAAIQTPQGFLYKGILTAHLNFDSKARKAAANGTPIPEPTDDTELWDLSGGTTMTVPGDPRNKKITYPEDLR